MSSSPNASASQLTFLRNIRTRSIQIGYLAALASLLFTPMLIPADTVGQRVIGVLGYILIAMGALGRMWCTVYIGGRKKQTLVTEGPYTLCRNPLYLFSTFIVFGVIGMLPSLVFAIIAVACFVLFHAFAIIGEERLLAANFGSDFTDYCERTPRFIPRIDAVRAAFKDEGFGDFSRRHVSRGLIDTLAFLLIPLLAELVVRLHASGKLPFGG
ncbi:MAG: hypothetical protein C0621_09165 [Desulfuromonas sp.]|nr:MAG: hypothetical protein C0621_09165 [Desulfuromonas sp.]